MTKFFLGSEAKFIQALSPAADAAGRQSVWVDLKYAGTAHLLVSVNQGNAATVLLTLLQASSAAGAGAKPLTDPCTILLDDGTGTGDVVTVVTPAVSYTTDATLANKMIIIRIDPAAMDINNGFGFLGFSTGASNAANITEAKFVLTDLRYAMQPPNQPTDLT